MRDHRGQTVSWWREVEWRSRAGASQRCPDACGLTSEGGSRCSGKGRREAKPWRSLRRAREHSAWPCCGVGLPVRYSRLPQMLRN